MGERLTIKEVNLKNHLTETITRDIFLDRLSADDTTRFLFRVSKEMEQGLDYYTKEGKKGRFGKRRGERELRDIKVKYPNPKEMQKILATLSGKSNNNVIVYKRENHIVGFKLEETKENK